ncbi:Competence protein CoiA-like family protein [Methanococcoides vulcani]|uniref:Competence protein CoiA-like family protein n=1 Tax=Methanococcoides vulcani TaxID=1353158 RepID=A0A1H9YD61_9EURY|nr:competence protein CoiA family protein [Methanococcoides vulcani]SES66399.1 Competence protein CoiA-like family protein [Methanococcoides vulcani]
MVEYEYALDKCGDPIHISKAFSKRVYYCPDCESELIPRKGDVNAHHYAHKNIEAHAGGGVGAKESALHSNSKCKVYDLLKNALNNQRHITLFKKCPFGETAYKDITYPVLLDNYPNINPMDINWPMNYYDFDYSNLHIKPANEFYYKVTETIDEVVLEKQDRSGYRPDISLLKDGTLIKAIEIVHTHDDSEEKTKYYQSNNIDVIKIFVPSESEYNLLMKCTNKLPSKITYTFLYSGCSVPYITTKQMLISNIYIQEIIKIRRMAHELSINYSDLESDYADLLFDIKLHISKIHQHVVREKEESIKNMSWSNEKLRKEHELFEHEILKKINEENYGQNWSISEICRQIQVGDFYKRVKEFERLMNAGIVFVDEDGYHSIY